MAKLVIENLAQKELPVTPASDSILQLVQSYGIDWMHACGGKGRCTTCKVIVVEGMDQLSPRSAAEQKYHRLNQLADNERLACQTQVKGTCRVRVPQENKLPHIRYTS